MGLRSLLPDLGTPRHTVPLLGHYHARAPAKTLRPCLDAGVNVTLEGTAALSPRPVRVARSAVLPQEHSERAQSLRSQRRSEPGFSRDPNRPVRGCFSLREPKRS